MDPRLRAVGRPAKRVVKRARARALARLAPRLPRRTSPTSRDFGYDRGLPIDRIWIEDFLRRHAPADAYGAGDIRGRVLEVGGDEYATRFGRRDVRGPGAMTRLDVLHVSADNPKATVVGDLADGTGIPTGAYDCVICTQVFNVLWDIRGAAATLHRMLAPGGTALITLPGIAPAARPDRDLWGDYWRFTSGSARRLFEEPFGAAGVSVEAYGNVFAASAFLYGLAAEELRPDELTARDPDFEALITVCARKATV